MGTGVQVWSDTAATNAGSDQNINWAEGMAPSQVNDSARAEMASVAKWRDDNSGTLVTSGSSTAYTITSNQVSTGNNDGYTIAARLHAVNSASATLNIDGQGAEPILLSTGSTGGLVGGEFSQGGTYRFNYVAAIPAWIVQGDIAPSGNSISYSQIQQVSNSRLLGNPSTSTSTTIANISEIALGNNLTFSSSGVLNGPTFYDPAQQILTSGSAATYTTSLSAANTLPLYLRVRMVAGGGGGGAASSNNGSSGTDTIFASWTCVGGGGGSHSSPSAVTGGSGGSNGTGTQIVRIKGGLGYCVGSLTHGGETPFGFGTWGVAENSTGGDPIANTGGGAAGGFGGAAPGSGGAGGEYAEFIITSPSSTYTYTVGTGGAGGAAGTEAGGTGAAGRIIVEAYWQ